MHDMKAIREAPDVYDTGWAKRGLRRESARLTELDDRRKAAIAAVQEVQTRRNEASKAIGGLRAKGRETQAQKLIDEVARLKSALQDGESQERQAVAALDDALAELPNIPLDDVPVGVDESANTVLREQGKKPDFSFAAKDHVEIGLALGHMDFEAAARLSGARFVVLSGPLARLERALAAFMLDVHTNEFGYTEVSPPLLVRDGALFGTGQLPKFASDQFRTVDDFWLIPTAEVSLTNLVREQILDEGKLPLRFTAGTPCFRSEAGAAGKDTHGMIRQHQFFKVELVSITTPEQSAEEHERMTACAEEILKRLGLAYRVVLLSTGDMGFSARKTYDLEIWLPGQDRYREISSCSDCGDFQARRMNARYRPENGKGTRFVHTLNGSGLAVGRALIAILENYQQADGSIAIPEVLRPYMGGLERIAAVR